MRKIFKETLRKVVMMLEMTYGRIDNCFVLCYGG